jgi:predicted porin
MKKTLIAAAIAAVVAAPVAMADVSVSGQVKYTVKNQGANDFNPSFDNALTFKASEDLGNGLSAFAQITLDTDSTTSAGNTVNAAEAATTGISSNKDQKVGLKGSFGTFVAGRMEYLTEGAVSSMMDDGLSSHSNHTDQLESALTYFGRDNAMAYVSPTMNGFHFAVAGSNAADNNNFTNTDIAAFYDNGPLSIKVSRASVDTTEDYDVTVVGASYTIGDAKISAMYVEKDFDGSSTDLEDKIVRLDYKLPGNNSLIIGHKSVDNESSTRDDVTSVKLTHSFSKRTAAYIGHRSIDASGTDNVDYIGMIHKF